MALGVAVAHDHGHVFAYALGAQSGLGEGRGHGEEVDGATVPHGEDAAHLAVLHVDHADGHVVFLPAVGLQRGFQYRHRLGGADHDGLMAQAQTFEQACVLVADNQRDYAAGSAAALHGLIAAEHAALARAAQDENAVAPVDQLAGLGGGAGHVQGVQSQFLAHVVGKLGVQAGLEQDGLGIHLHPVNILVDREDLVNLQGGHGQGDQRGDAVALLQVDLPLQIVAQLGDCTHKHAAGAGNGVLLLAALRHDLQDLGSDLLIVVSGLVGDLGKGSRVDVQGGDVHQDLVGVDLVHIVIDTVGRLGQDALGLDDPVRAVPIAFFLHGSTSRLEGSGPRPAPPYLVD